MTTGRILIEDAVFSADDYRGDWQRAFVALRFTYREIRFFITYVPGQSKDRQISVSACCENCISVRSGRCRSHPGDNATERCFPGPKFAIIDVDRTSWDLTRIQICKKRANSAPCSLGEAGLRSGELRSGVMYPVDMRIGEACLDMLYGKACPLIS